MIKSIKIETALASAGLMAALIVCLAATVIFAKWCFADAIATRAPNKEIAEFTVALAPRDPQTHYALAVLNDKSFLPEDQPKSLRDFGQAVALAPNDFRLWLAYGRALERGGDAALAEIALKKALELAPNYAAAQWTLGNALLRGGKTREGFEEIRRAAENDPAYRLPSVTTAWQIFDGSYAEVKQAVGTSANLSSAFAVFLAEQKRLNEAVEIWNTLGAEDKKTVYKADGERLFAALTAAGKFRAALQIQNSFGAAVGTEKFAAGKIHNGDFEAELAREKAGVFDWQIADGAQPQIGPNVEQKHGGERSIFIIFNSTDGKDFRQISQTVIVEPGGKYVFSGFYKSNLKTAATLRWEIADAADGKILAAASPIAATTADWTNLSVPFAAAAGTEAVVVRLAREQCKSIVCPISGVVWFDDFSINQ